MSQKIYVGNLSNNVANEVLAEKFSKGFAFVEMESPEDAEKAIINLNGTLLEGRCINVTEAKKPSMY